MKQRETAVAAKQSDPHSGDPLLIGAGEVAALLSVSVSTVWRLRDQGILPPSLKLGGCVRWRRSDILRHIDQL